MSVVAVIPARGGSKGIPRKNLQEINGLPLVAWSIRAAIGSSVDAVYVSTEDNQIAATARKYGAKVIERPAELATDEAHTLPVLQHAAEVLGLVGDDILICMECTSPFHTTGDVELVRKGLECHCADASHTVCEDHSYQLRPTPTGITWITHDRKTMEAPRQELPLTFRLGGGLGAYRADYLATCENCLEGNVNPVEIPAERCLDIDTPMDLHVAQVAAEYLDRKHWIVLGSSPSAASGFQAAKNLQPGAKTITTNRCEELFAGYAHPDVYHIHDVVACEIHQDAARRFQALGTTLVTLNKSPASLKTRGVEWFDEFLEMADIGQHPGTFKQGKYASCGLSGMMCLQYALNHGATDVHLVGMEGYADHGHYFNGSSDNGPEKSREMTQTIIEPFVQSCIDACPDVTFHFYGKLNYEVSGGNVRWIG